MSGIIVGPNLEAAREPKTEIVIVGGLQTYVYEDVGFHRSPREEGAVTAMGLVTFEESFADVCEIAAANNQLVQALLREVLDLRAQIAELSQPAESTGPQATERD